METDSFWKEVLEALFREFMQFFFPDIYRDIDFSKGYSFLDKEFQQITRKSKSSKKIVDKLVKVYLQDGKETWLLIHIEIQGQKEKDFAQRMYMYNYRIFDKYQKEVISLALLTDNDPNYLPDTYELKRWHFHHTFKFPLAKIINYINYEFDKEYRSNVFSLIVQAYLKTMETEGDDQTRFQWKRQFILLLSVLGVGHETLRHVFRFIEWIMILPDPLEDRLYKELEEMKEENKMTFITYPERKALEKGRKEGIQKGIQKGIEKGIKEGIQQGRRQGEINGLLKAIQSVLEVKFEHVPQSIRSNLAKIRSLEKLEELLHQAKLVKSLDEFVNLLNNEVK